MGSGEGMPGPGLGPESSESVVRMDGRVCLLSDDLAWECCDGDLFSAGSLRSSGISDDGENASLDKLGDMNEFSRSDSRSRSGNGVSVTRGRGGGRTFQQV